MDADPLGDVATLGVGAGSLSVGVASLGVGAVLSGADVAPLVADAAPLGADESALAVERGDIETKAAMPSAMAETCRAPYVMATSLLLGVGGSVCWGNALARSY